MYKRGDEIATTGGALYFGKKPIPPNTRGRIIGPKEESVYRVEFWDGSIHHLAEDEMRVLDRFEVIRENIDRLEELLVPKETIESLRVWLDEEMANE